MKSKRACIIGVGILSIFLILYILIQPIIDFETKYFNTPEKAITHYFSNTGSKIQQTLLINTEYGFAFCIDDKDTLFINNINSWTMFGNSKFGCHDGTKLDTYASEENELGITAFLNYKNVDTYFYHSYAKVNRGDKFLVVGGLTRLPHIDTLLIDGQKPSLCPVIIAGEKYIIWYIVDSNKKIIVNYDGEYLCTI